MLADILTVLKVLPALLSFGREFAGWLRETFGDSPEKFLVDATETFAVLRQAKSKEEKVDAARRIQSLISRL